MYYFYQDKKNLLDTRYFSRLVFNAHIHNHMELVYMLEGQSGAAVDFKEYIIKEGDAFIVFPNQVHQYFNDNGKGIVLIFPLDLCLEFRKMFKQKMPRNPLISGLGHESEAVSIMKRIIEAVNQPTQYTETLVKGYFLSLLSLLSEKLEFEEQEPTDFSTIKRVLHYCEANYASDISLDGMSEALHMNKFYLSHTFRQKLYMGFRDYINMLRINEAQRLLRLDELSITEIAYQVGFNSPRSFNRAFLAITGITPGQYRKTPIENV